MNDRYDNGTPKYKTAQSIYEGLRELTETEEMYILGEMFPDVSYESEEYYYHDAGAALKERFRQMYDYGEKMWLMDLAVLQMDGGDMHDIIYQAMYNQDLAKRLGFKKLFIEHLLQGESTAFDEVVEMFCAELQDLDRFDWYSMNAAFGRVLEARGRPCHGVWPLNYTNLCNAVYKKVHNLHLQKETHLIAESRALLTSYDDFMFGLRMNQALFADQERRYNEQVAKLNAAYAEQVTRLNALAAQHGIPLGGTLEPICIESVTEQAAPLALPDIRKTPPTKR